MTSQRAGPLVSGGGASAARVVGATFGEMAWPGAEQAATNASEPAPRVE